MPAAKIADDQCKPVGHFAISLIQMYCMLCT